MTEAHVDIYVFGENGSNKAITQCARNFGKTLGDADKFVARVRPDSRFYFLCSRTVDLERYARATGFYIVDTADYNDDLVIGFGFYSVLAFDGLVWHSMEREEADRWEELLTFHFLRKHPYTYYPGSTRFSGSFTVTVEDREAECYHTKAGSWAWRTRHTE